MSYQLAFLGAGQMAEAIARGILRAKLFSTQQMTASDPSPARRDLFQSLGISTFENNSEAARDARIVLLAVKPYHVRDVLASVAAVFPSDALLISICAGVSTQTIEAALGRAQPRRVIRSMPNTPMLVGEGAVAIAAGTHATPADLAAARTIFQCAAEVVELPEAQLDAVTALSGSGPAYFFFLVEHLIQAGIEMGLSPENSRKLAVKTAYGSAKMMLGSPESPADLRAKVTTPNGTTHAAVTHMESHAMPRIIVEALKAAARRSRELGS